VGRKRELGQESGKRAVKREEVTWERGPVSENLFSQEDSCPDKEGGKRA